MPGSVRGAGSAARASPSVSRFCSGSSSRRVQDDNPTPRPTVQAENGISPEGKGGPVSWALQGGAGPQLWEMSAEMSGIWERVRAVGASLRS